MFKERSIITEEENNGNDSKNCLLGSLRGLDHTGKGDSSIAVCQHSRIADRGAQTHSA